MTSAAKTLLILYTGGTIGMVASEKGLVAASGFEHYLKTVLDKTLDKQGYSWELKEIQPLIDSANMTPNYWQTLVAQIMTAIETKSYTGILVLHGTDSLAYTAAALSFQLLGLNLPIILTGSMLPAGVPQSDAEQNICGAIAALMSKPRVGVSIYFHGDLISGVRCLKWRSEGEHAFVSPKALQGKTKVDEIPESLTYKAVANDSPHVVILPIYPTDDYGFLKHLVNADIDGILLECYGSGTVPNEQPNFMQALQQLVKQGVTMVAISQCAEGYVDFSCYESAHVLQTLGVISGHNLTREAALAKLTRLLSLGFSQQDIAYWFTQNLCGELGNQEI